MSAPRVLAQADPTNLIALFLVLDGELVVYANTRHIAESEAIAWAERLASDGRVFDCWFMGDELSA